MKFIHKFILAPAVMAAAALTATSAGAETINVPFAFKVGNTVCPPGRYAVQHDNTNNFVTLIGKDSPELFSWVLRTGAPNEINNKIALQFDDLDQTRQLHSIQYRGMSTYTLDRKALKNERESIRLTGGR
jgi:hypothetical protein